MAETDPFPIGQHDTRPKWTATLYTKFGTPDQAPADLTGVTVKRFLMRASGETGAPKVDDSAHLVVLGAPTDGRVQHTWQAAHTDEPGTFDVQVKITQADGGVVSFPNEDGVYFKVVVGDDLSD